MEKQELLNEIWSIYTRIDDLDPFHGQAALCKAVRGHYNWLQGHKTDTQVERLILDECKKKLVEAGQGIAVKQRGYGDAVPG
jgi:hypothetical protein